MLTYFDSNQNAKVTAQRLRIHVNTVRQRLASPDPSITGDGRMFVMSNRGILYAFDLED